MPPSGPLRRQTPSTAEREQALQQLRAFATNPRTLSLAGLWVFGLLAMFCLPAPSAITDSKLNLFEGKLKEVTLFSKATLALDLSQKDTYSI